MAQINSSFGYKITWFALKDVMIDTILVHNPNFTNAAETTWEKGLMAAERSIDKVFLSGSYDGWAFLVGVGLPDPSQMESLMPLLQKLGELAKEVCYFSSRRIVSSYGFARVVQGCLTRLYGYSGEQGHVYANIGERTEAEKNLSLNFSTNDSELFAEGFDEIDEEHIIQLAEQWSLDPDNLFGMEEQECVIADIN